MTTQKRDIKRKFPVVRQPASIDLTPAAAPKTISVTQAAPEPFATTKEAVIPPASPVETVVVAPAKEPAPQPARAQPASSVLAKVTVEPAAGAAWSKVWPTKSLDIWNENATAFVEFATALSKAKTIAEVVTLQSQFLNDRFGSYSRLSSEVVTLAQDIAKEAGGALPKAFFTVS
jgi:cytochrome c peroxidase